MPEEVELDRGPTIAERLIGGWRVVASAWVVAVVFVLLFAGVQALASLHSAAPRQQSLAGAMIPRHDPSCAGPEIPAGAQNCESTHDAMERAAADAYSGW